MSSDDPRIPTAADLRELARLGNVAGGGPVAEAIYNVGAAIIGALMPQPIPVPSVTVEGNASALNEVCCVYSSDDIKFIYINCRVKRMEALYTFVDGKNRIELSTDEVLNLVTVVIDFHDGGDPNWHCSCDVSKNEIFVFFWKLDGNRVPRLWPAREESAV